MKPAPTSRAGLGDWALALAAAAAVAVYLVRHRSLLSDLAPLLEALF